MVHCQQCGHKYHSFPFIADLGLEEVSKATATMLCVFFLWWWGLNPASCVSISTIGKNPSCFGLSTMAQTSYTMMLSITEGLRGGYDSPPSKAGTQELF